MIKVKKLRVLLCILFCVLVTFPLLGFKSSGDIYDDFTYGERYSQPTNPSGVGTRQNSTNTYWNRIGVSFIIDGYITATSDYDWSNGAVNSLPPGNFIEYSGTTRVIFKSNINALHANGTHIQMRFVIDVVRDGFKPNTPISRGASLLDNMLYDTDNKSGLLNHLSTGSRTGYLSAVLSGRTGSESIHSELPTTKSYRDGASAFTSPVRSYYNYTSFYNGYNKNSDTRKNTLENLGANFFGVAVAVPKIPQLDNVAPAVSVSANTTSWTSGNVTLTGSATDAGSGVKRIQDPGGNWHSAASRAYAVSANGTYTFTAEDNEGNSGSKAYTVSNIDKTGPAAPSVSVSRTGWGNTAATFTPSGGADSQSGRDRYGYSIGGGTWIGNSGSAVSVTAEGAIGVRVVSIDKVENWSGVTSVTVYNDFTKPTVPVITPSRTGWGSSNPTFTVTGGSDALSGLASRQYKVGSGAWTGYSTAVTVSNEGETTIYARTVDNAGNISNEVSTKVYKDSNAPGVTFSPNGGTWAMSHSVTVTPTDSGSGIKIWYYTLRRSDGTAIEQGSATNANPKVFNMNEPGEYWVETSITDNAGNNSTPKSNSFYVDKTPPSHVSHSMNGQAYKSGNDYWIKGGGSINFVDRASDTESGLRSMYFRLVDNAKGYDARAYQYMASATNHIDHWDTDASIVINAANRSSVSGGAATVTWTATALGSYQGDYLVQYYYLDNAGNNVGYVDTGMVLRVDTTAPAKPSLTLSNVNWTPENVTVTLSHGADARSGVARTEYRVAGGAWTTYTAPFVVSTAGQSLIEARTIDKVGNISAISSDTVMIDRSVPTVSTSSTDYTWGKVNKSISLTYADGGGSGLAVQQYAVTKTTATPTSGWLNYTGALSINSDGGYYIHYKVVDNAGNQAVGYYGPYRVDKTAPTVGVSDTNYNWVRTDRSIGLTYEDQGGSGIIEKKYAVTTTTVTPAAGWLNYSTPIELVANGTYYVHYKVTDGAGNTKEGYFGPYKIDKIAPTIEFSKSSVSWTQSVTVKVTVADTGTSGINTSTIKYNWSTSNTAPSTWLDLPGDGNVSQSGDGKWYLHVKASDIAGNETVVVTGTYNIDTKKPNGEFELDYDPHTSNLTITPVGIYDQIENLASSGLKEMRVTVTAETAGGNEVLSQVINSNFNTPFLFKGKSVHLNFNGKANKITVHVEVEDNAGNINNGMQDKEALVYYMNSNVVKSADGMVVGVGNKVQGGDMLMVYVEAFGNPDSIEVKGYKVGDPTKLLKNFNYVINNTGNLSVVTDPLRQTSIYSELLNQGKPIFVDVYQEPGSYNLEIIMKKGGASPIVRTQTHVVNVDTDPVITELRTRLFFKMPSR